MKAIVCEKYGPPDVLRIDDLPTPTPADDEIRVRVRATSVTVADVRTRAFRVPPMYWLPGRLALGITGPRNAVLGAELAGEVDAVGKAVTRFAVGDEVIALMAHDMGGYAQYKCLPEDAVIAKKPANLSFEEAAVVPVGGLTAFTFLHVGGIQPGQHILIYGASGSVGTYAVQLAKYFGAEVTGVCSGRNIDLVRSLGADHVIDYTVQDFTQIGDTYDIVFDAHGSTTFAQVKPILKPKASICTV
jgi:NADPH:quinone reductase-like Zn-dependent oxidoreductase